MVKIDKQVLTDQDWSAYVLQSDDFLHQFHTS